MADAKVASKISIFSCLGCSQDDTGAGAGLGTSSANVNRYIQQLAQEYSGDCKTSFDELSKIIQVREEKWLIFPVTLPFFSVFFPLI